MRSVFENDLRTSRATKDAPWVTHSPGGTNLDVEQVRSIARRVFDLDLEIGAVETGGDFMMPALSMHA